jgi:hypothetical protein
MFAMGQGFTCPFAGVDGVGGGIESNAFAEGRLAVFGEAGGREEHAQSAPIESGICNGKKGHLRILGILKMCVERYKDLQCEWFIARFWLSPHGVLSNLTINVRMKKKTLLGKSCGIVHIAGDSNNKSHTVGSGCHVVSKGLDSDGPSSRLIVALWRRL